MCDTVVEVTTDQVDLQKLCKTDYGVDDTDYDAGVSVKTFVIITLHSYGV
jgi:hypothetical protein